MYLSFQPPTRFFRLVILILGLASMPAIAQSPNCGPEKQATVFPFFVSADRQAKGNLANQPPQSSPRYAVGDASPTRYAISWAPPDSPILWSSTVIDVSTNY